MMTDSRPLPDVVARHPVLDVHSDYAIQVYRAAAEGRPDALFAEHLPRLRAGGVSMEVLTVGGDFELGALELWDLRLVLRIMEEARRQIAAHEEFRLVLDAGGLGEAASRGGTQGASGDPVHFMFALEGIRCVEDVATLRVLHAAGLRSVILTHNARNLAADGCGEPHPGGLSNFGRRIVGEVRALNMVLDLVHLSDLSFFDALDLYDRPPMVSHSNSRALCGNRRNLTDEQIRRVGERGGVIGLNFLGMFVADDPAQATPDRLADHAVHIAELAGPESLALGPDYADYYMDAMHAMLVRENLSPESIGFIAGAEDVARLPVFVEALARRGFSDDDLAGILGGNALRLYRTVFGAEGPRA